VAMKGPTGTPFGVPYKVERSTTRADGATGTRTYPSVAIALRKELELFANVRPVKNYPGVNSRFAGIDIVLFRENSEDLYLGRERMVDADTAEALKIITRGATQRMARFAAGYMRKLGRKRVTIGHKSNETGSRISCAARRTRALGSCRGSKWRPMRPPEPRLSHCMRGSRDWPKPGVREGQWALSSARLRPLSWSEFAASLQASLCSCRVWEPRAGRWSRSCGSARRSLCRLEDGPAEVSSSTCLEVSPARPGRPTVAGPA